MSRENVELVREGYDTFNRGGVLAMVAESYWAPDVVWDATPMAIPGLGIYRGPDGVAAFLEKWLGSFDASGWRIEVLKLIDGGDRVVAVVRQHGRGAASGAAVEFEFAQVFEVRSGQVTRITGYMGREEALGAVGLSDGALDDRQQ